MVGCIKVADAIKWAQGKSTAEVLELLVSLSASAYDYYLRLARVTDRDDIRAVFAALSAQERANISFAANALEKVV